METFWTLAIASVSGLWVLVTYIRDSRSRIIDQSSAAMSRLMQQDNLSAEAAEVQQYLSKTAKEPPSYFRSPDRLDELIFFQGKTLVYTRLNIIDEILSASKPQRRLPRWLRPEEIIELKDWKSYFLTTLSHPLARSIMADPVESKIFGKELRKFYESHKKDIPAPDPFIW